MQENMQEHTPQLMSRSNTDNTFIAEQSTPEVSTTESKTSADAHENDSNDSFHTQSLVSLGKSTTQCRTVSSYSNHCDHM